MNLNHVTNKTTGSTLSAQEWNKLAEDVNELGAGGAGSSGSTVAIDTNGVVSVNDKGNTTISSAKHINIEPAYVANGGEGTYGDVQIKPGDDITLESHHRAVDKRDEIIIKTSNGKDKSDPDKSSVKLQVKAANLTLSTDGKKVPVGSNDATNVMNVNVTTGSGKGYLKVRAQAIDLRCEEHGGIALQPKGEDSSHHMNKIKFEHGGGDGLEFGTFNTEKTSIFTDEYRFNREGVWKMATREKLDNSVGLTGTAGVTVGNGKYDPTNDGVDETKHYSYKKQSDDFYDVIDQDDEQCTTKDIIKTAYAMNGGKDRHTKITNNGAIEIATNVTWTIHITEDNGSSVNVNTISDDIAALASVSEGMAFNEKDFKVSGDAYVPDTTAVYTNGTQYFSFVEVASPAIKIESGGELKLGGILDFGSSFNFGETDNGIEFQYKLTKKNAQKDCGVLKVVGVNNHATNSLTVEGVTVAPGETETIAQCSVLDIIKLVNYMKTNNQGPWEA